MAAPFLSLYQRMLERALASGLLPRARVLKRVNRFIKARLTPRRVSVAGHEMWLDPVDSLGLARARDYEPLETAIVRSEVKPGARVLDLGANIGYFSLLLARCVGPQGSVIAVEPDPDNAMILRRNVEANGYRNVKVLEKAASDAAGTTRLYRQLRSGAHHSLAEQAPGDAYIEIGTVRLDDVVTGPIDFMKIDVEGAEMLAMAGAERLMAQSPDLVLLTEYNPRALAAFGVDPEDYLLLLERLGFSLSNVDHATGTVGPCTRREILSRYNTTTGRYTNLLCKRGLHPPA